MQNALKMRVSINKISLIITEPHSDIADIIEEINSAVNGIYKCFTAVFAVLAIVTAKRGWAN